MLKCIHSILEIGSLKRVSLAVIKVSAKLWLPLEAPGENLFLGTSSPGGCQHPWLVAASFLSTPLWSHCSLPSYASLLLRILLMALRGHLESPGKSPHLKNLHLGVLWLSGGKESTCQCKGRGFGPWFEEIPRATGQLSPWAATAEPRHLEPVLRNNERPTHRDGEQPPLATIRESPPSATETQCSQK